MGFASFGFWSVEWIGILGRRSYAGVSAGLYQPDTCDERRLPLDWTRLYFFEFLLLHSTPRFRFSDDIVSSGIREYYSFDLDSSLQCLYSICIHYV